MPEFFYFLVLGTFGGGGNKNKIKKMLQSEQN